MGVSLVVSGVVIAWLATLRLRHQFSLVFTSPPEVWAMRDGSLLVRTQTATPYVKVWPMRRVLVRISFDGPGPIATDFESRLLTHTGFWPQRLVAEIEIAPNKIPSKVTQSPRPLASVTIVGYEGLTGKTLFKKPFEHKWVHVLDQNW